MNNFRQFLQGKKTFLAVIIGGLYLLGVWADLWKYSEAVLGAIGLGGLAFLRLALLKPQITPDTPNPESKSDGSALLPVALLLCGVMFTGCVSNPAGRALGTTATTVDSAMKGWAQYVATGQATAADELAVQDAYAKYQLAMTAARKTYAAAYKAGDANLFTVAAEALKGSQQELLALVQKLQVKPKPQAMWQQWRGDYVLSPLTDPDIKVVMPGQPLQ